MPEVRVIQQHWAGTTRRDSPQPPLICTVQQAGRPDLTLSVDPAYGGVEEQWHPPDLVGAALSTCLMVAFLDLARRARLDVRAYQDEVTLHRTTEDHRTRIDRAVVSPRIRLAPGTDPERAAAVFRRAHQYCTVSNSLRMSVVLDPRFIVLPQG